MTHPVRLLAVILHYGDPALARRLFEELTTAELKTPEASAPALSASPRVRVFDNAAPEPYLDSWQRAATNGYWTGALQNCLNAARSEGFTHLWFLNNDLTFVSPPPSVARLEARLAQLAEHAFRIAGQACGPVGVWSPAVLRSPYHPQMRHLPGKQACSVSLVDGIAPVYALDCVEAVGGLDALDNPYGYGVDMWLSLRAARAGWPVLVDHSVVIRHRHHTTARTLEGFMDQAAATEAMYLLRRLGPHWQQQLENLKTETL